MGKVNKKKNRRNSPYSRGNGNGDMEIDSSSGPAAIPGQLVEKTRGAILQRHKKEYKQVRSQVGNMRMERLRLRKSDKTVKKERRAQGNEIKSVMKTMQDRHAQELAEFDAKEAAKNNSNSSTDQQEESMEADNTFRLNLPVPATSKASTAASGGSILFG